MISKPIRKVMQCGWVLTLTILLGAQSVQAEEMEEIVVVGTQIQGASITDIIPVSVLDEETIENLGVDSGDALLLAMPEHGQNFFSEAENISGGVNSARGDVGAFNLRNIGTGNSLALLNGRRLVNSAVFQTEEIGGSFVPVATANTNVIPVYGVRRIEVLRDGASAIYGADAVAGVVNTVLKSDFEGLNVRYRSTEYDNLSKGQFAFNIEYGGSFNDGRSNIGIFVDFYEREAINSQDDAKWADADFRRLIPEGSAWEGNTSFRNTSTNSGYGQFDVVSSVSRNDLIGTIFDSAGEFEVFPLDHRVCNDESENPFVINGSVCGAPDGNGTVRYNLNENRDLRSELSRSNMFVYLNHEISDTLELFSELSWYNSTSDLVRHPSASLSAVRLRVGASNYYNPLGPVGSPNRLPDELLGDNIPDEGLALTIDNYRYVEVPRLVENNADTWRLLLGWRGEMGGGDWTWESAFLASKATRDDITHNRISNTLIQEALNDSTPAAYNPFTGSGTATQTNIGRALVSVYRKGTSKLSLFDLKFTNSELFNIASRSAALAFGMERRKEEFVDDRDPRLDGTIVFTDHEGDTFPLVSDVVNSSPTPDGKGSRTVTSMFAELHLPLLDNLDMQLALRNERFSDVDDPTVGKVAVGYRPIEQVLIRGSWSQTYRAPNLIQINETTVARSNTRNDWGCFFIDPDEDALDCRHGIIRTSVGSRDLVSEESTNTNIGVVIEPIDDLVLTLDYWSIEKDSTIGLFGEENHTVLELLNMIEARDAGTLDCSLSYNPAVVRAAPTAEERALYEAEGLCALGELERVDDIYRNLNPRDVKGIDIGAQYTLRLNAGSLTFDFKASMLEEYEQVPGTNAARIQAALANGTLPANIPLTGFGDLIGRDGNQEYKHLLNVTWRSGDYSVALVWQYLDEFYQNSLTLSNGSRYVIPEHETFNLAFSYRFEDIRLRVGMNNFTDERAPLADRFFGFFADAHSDYGSAFYFDVKYFAF